MARAECRSYTVRSDTLATVTRRLLAFAELPHVSIPPSLAQRLRSQEFRRAKTMLYYALVFLIVGLVAGALGLFGVAAVASQIAWLLFLIGIILLVVHLVTGRGGARIP